MKANKFKGNARKGALKRNYTIKVKDTASYAGEKIHKSFTQGRSFNHKGLISLAEKVYEQFTTPGYFAFMKKYAKKNNSSFSV